MQVALSFRIRKLRGGGLPLVLHGLGSRGATMQSALAKLSENDDYYAGIEDSRATLINSSIYPVEKMAVGAEIAVSSPQLTNYILTRLGEVIVLRLSSTSYLGCDTACNSDCKPKNVKVESDAHLVIQFIDQHEERAIPMPMPVPVPMPTPSTSAPPPSPPDALLPPALCNFLLLAQHFSLIIKEEAHVPTQAHSGGLAIGGTLVDTTPSQQGVVQGQSFVSKFAISDGKAAFDFVAGNSEQPDDFPFAWAELEKLSQILSDGTYMNGLTVKVISQGSETWKKPLEYLTEQSLSGHVSGDVLVVFRDAGDVVLKTLAVDAKVFRLSVLAPRASVRLESYDKRRIGGIQGFIAAKDFKTKGPDELVSSITFSSMEASTFNSPIYCP